MMITMAQDLEDNLAKEKASIASVPECTRSMVYFPPFGIVNRALSPAPNQDVSLDVDWSATC